MFRPSYLKEGPGIAKDAPEKTGAAWVGETLAREFWQIVKLNVLFLSIPPFSCYFHTSFQILDRLPK